MMSYTVNTEEPSGEYNVRSEAETRLMSCERLTDAYLPHTFIKNVTYLILARLEQNGPGTTLRERFNRNGNIEIEGMSGQNSAGEPCSFPGARTLAGGGWVASMSSVANAENTDFSVVETFLTLIT